jgi:hypothetical protein
MSFSRIRSFWFPSENDAVPRRPRGVDQRPRPPERRDATRGRECRRRADARAHSSGRRRVRAPTRGQGPHPKRHAIGTAQG